MTEPDWNTLASRQGVAPPPVERRPRAAELPVEGMAEPASGTDWGGPAGGMSRSPWGRLEARGWRQLLPFTMVALALVLRLALELLDLLPG